MSQPGSKVKGFRLSDEQCAKLQRLADTLSTNPNAIMRQLLDNAQLEPVEHLEAVSKLPVKTNSGASIFQSESTAVLA